MKRKATIIAVIILILLASQYKSILAGYARFFIVDNITIGGNASIVVLSGGPFTRIPKALELHQKGYGERLLLTTLHPLNSKFAHLILTNEQIAREISKILAIPATFESVPSLKGGATSTFDEAHDLLAYCIKEKIKYLIIVTDAFHTRRALYAFKKIFQDSNIKIEVSAAFNEVHSEENWWRSDSGIAAYLLEPIKFAVYLLSDQNVSFIKNN
jgi:uncharacterized SAM-binding protein YcdF (DUF218 family)